MVAIYARQSIDKKDSISIESQIETCKDGLSPEIDYKIYFDKGYTGGNTNRPQFKMMMDDIDKDKIDKVVVYKLDRLSRSLLDFANIWEKFKKKKVSFSSKTENFDTSTPMGLAAMSITMVFAQLERETICQRVKTNYYARGRMGMYLGGPPPYGFDKEVYKIDGKKTSMLVPNEWMDVVRRLYSLYVGGKSLGEISSILNEEGINAHNGGNWDSLKISRLLHNPVYVKANSDVFLYYRNRGCTISNDVTEFLGINGCYLYGKRDRKAAKYTDVKEHVLSLAPHKGIIDSDSWLACQYRLDVNRQIGNSGKGKYTWLTGLTKCGKCSYAMTVVTNRGKRYFNCRGKTNLHKCEGQSVPIHVEDIERSVENELLEKLENIKSSSLSIKKPLDLSINRLKADIAKVEEDMDAFTDQIPHASAATMKRINEKIDELESKKIALNDELEKKMLESNVVNVDDFSVNNFLRNWATYSLEEKKETAYRFISKVKIFDGEIEIEWRF